VCQMCASSAKLDLIYSGSAKARQAGNIIDSADDNRREINLGQLQPNAQNGSPVKLAGVFGLRRPGATPTPECQGVVNTHEREAVQIGRHRIRLMMLSHS
jgi:hypothetical protein